MRGTFGDIGRLGVERPALLRPCRGGPDFDKPAGTDNDHVFAEARILAELHRHNDAGAAVERPDVST